MTDDERRMEDMMLGKHLGKDKGTIKFMQKYYHKGAFYMVSGGGPGTTCYAALLKRHITISPSVCCIVFLIVYWL